MEWEFKEIDPDELTKFLILTLTDDGEVECMERLDSAARAIAYAKYRVSLGFRVEVYEELGASWALRDKEKKND